MPICNQPPNSAAPLIFASDAPDICNIGHTFGNIFFSCTLLLLRHTSTSHHLGNANQKISMTLQGDNVCNLYIHVHDIHVHM